MRRNELLKVTKLEPARFTKMKNLGNLPFVPDLQMDEKEVGETAWSWANYSVSDCIALRAMMDAMDHPSPKHGASEDADKLSGLNQRTARALVENGLSELFAHHTIGDLFRFDLDDLWIAWFADLFFEEAGREVGAGTFLAGSLPKILENNPNSTNLRRIVLVNVSRAARSVAECAKANGIRLEPLGT